MDSASAGQYAIKYFADVLGGLPGVKVTLLWIFQERDLANAPGEGSLESYRQELRGSGQTTLALAKETLMQGGVPENGIQVKILNTDNKSPISGTIMEELANGNYHTVVLGKRDLTKTQEFLFGSVNIKLLREAPVSVLSVKVPPHEAEDAST